MISAETFAHVGEGPTKPVTVTINQGTLAAAREVAGARGVSALVERAVQGELRRLALQSLVEDYERENGVIPDAAVAAQMERLAQARGEA
ncbi:MAG: hypothetical protein LBL01_07630 [Bifidobacteriaceae bacterium]|jgi:hypothetical protein|nr:hypothetical protein [Bifidobacteriaceae bacterium]